MLREYVAGQANRGANRVGSDDTISIQEGCPIRPHRSFVRSVATGFIVATLLAGFVPVDRIGAAYPDTLPTRGSEAKAPRPDLKSEAKPTMMPGLGAVQAGSGRVEAESALKRPVSVFAAVATN